jgi:hypothetical protein
MDTSDDWASDGPVNADTLDAVMAAVFKDHLDLSLMTLDHVLDNGKEECRAQMKAALAAKKKGKGKTGGALGNYARAMATEQPPSLRDMTPLLYAAAPFSPGASLALSTPTPLSRSSPQDRFIQAMHGHVVAFPQYLPPPPLFARFAEEVLGFVWQVLRNPHLKDQPLPHGMCGTSSFEVALTQIIAQSGPPPPEAAPLAPPPVPSTTQPCPADMDSAVTPQKPKRVKSLHPAPPLTSAASKKHAPAPAVAAPQHCSNTKASDTALKPAAPTADPSSSSSKRRCWRRKGKHTAHSPLRHGIQLTPPAGSSIHANSITPELIQEINTHLRKDVDSDIILESAFDTGTGIFIAASAVPSPSDVACVLKHMRHLLPVSGLVPIKADPTTSYLKVVDVLLVSAEPGAWQLTQRVAFNKALALSPVGSQLSRFTKHAPCFMRTSPCTDTCIAWVDITDTVSGATARTLISKYIAFGNVNCQIRGAAPWPGSALCTWCLKWGHHSSVCRSKGIRCPHCSGPHSAASHDSHAVVTNQDPAARHCVNCSAAKKSKTDHSTMGTTCLFWTHRFDRDWLKRQRVTKKQP